MMFSRSALGLTLLGLAAFTGLHLESQGRMQTKVQRHEREIDALQRKVKALELANRGQRGQRLPKATMNLHDAASKDEIAQLRFALNAGAAVDLRDSRGRTPLLAACLAGKVRAARYLLVNGADPMAKDKDGKTSLALARQSGNQDLLTLLVEYGAR